ncbi:hypothetical protein K437DRAFT_128260 [Tilletiaria anomala UBC 951]|uniref:Uncharacterized protein n=1 Tax=Tilletiaria anomala (strain ATCC 24038 / CBS 436.72 / UBC 951) TaxID=1037660 RepID=A0A066W2A3_TILAU|nr:uncharacterized protein K437DRAFT_128260 [Tilletiaria anomala UBC 951]KDN44885.1 hypothetical protein K437DRAFT_128260 [Tilletiaria anomala UBC 951]
MPGIARHACPSILPIHTDWPCFAEQLRSMRRPIWHRLLWSLKLCIDNPAPHIAKVPRKQIGTQLTALTPVLPVFNALPAARLNAALEANKWAILHLHSLLLLVLEAGWGRCSNLQMEAGWRGSEVKENTSAQRGESRQRCVWSSSPVPSRDFTDAVLAGGCRVASRGAQISNGGTYRQLIP